MIFHFSQLLLFYWQRTSFGQGKLPYARAFSLLCTHLCQKFFPAYLSNQQGKMPGGVATQSTAKASPGVLPGKHSLTAGNQPSLGSPFFSAAFAAPKAPQHQAVTADKAQIPFFRRFIVLVNLPPYHFLKSVPYKRISSLRQVIFYRMPALSAKFPPQPPCFRFSPLTQNKKRRASPGFPGKALLERSLIQYQPKILTKVMMILEFTKSTNMAPTRGTQKKAREAGP